MITGKHPDVTPAPRHRTETALLGVGNLLLSDEGVGVHVVKQLMGMALPPGVEVIDGGVSGLGLLGAFTEKDRLIVIDAVRGGEAPGSLYRFGIEDLTTYPQRFKMSIHEAGIVDVVRLARLLGRIPKTTIIGVEPKSLEMGMDLSPEIQARVPRVIELVFEELKQPL
jgi:hydrogenase maturation protease